MRSTLRALLLVTFAVTSSGCLKKLALGSVADSLSGTGNGFGRDDDPELVRDSLPVVIKVMEQIHDGLPKHEPLAVSLTQAVTSYAVAFVAEEADRVEEKDVEAARTIRLRARKLLLRGRKYGLDALDVSVPGIGAALLGNDRELRARLLAKTKKSDVGALYWAGAAWGSAIANSKDDMELVGQLPQVAALMTRALEVDESYGEGSIHEFFITYAASQNDKKAAKEHFERAVQLSHEKKMSTLVTYAEAICVDAQDKKEFTRLLEKVIAFDVDSDLDHRLVNVLAQRRAKWLMSRVADLFAE